MTPTIHQQLDLYLDGRLPPDAATAFAAHLPGCAPCRERIARWEKGGALLEAWAEPFAGAPTAEQLRSLRKAADAPRPSRRWALVLAGAGVMAMLVAWLALPRAGTSSEWDVVAEAGAAPATIGGVLTLGSSLGESRIRLGPDALQVARASQVEVLEKAKARTRLRLTRGQVSAHVEPGHPGRQFIIESEPFRITVVGTVFDARRDGPLLKVETREGLVRVERLAADGSVVESRQVGAGENVELTVEPAPAPAPEAPDAGEPEVEAPRPMPRAAPTPAQLLAWRKRAGQGECAQVAVEAATALKGAPVSVGALRVYADCSRKLGETRRAVASYLMLVGVTKGPEAAEALLLAVSLLQDDLHDPNGVIANTRALGAVRGPAAVLGALHLRRAQALKEIDRRDLALKEVEVVLKSYGSTPAAAEAVRLKTELTSP